MLAVVAEVLRLAPFDTPVVFVGETGTGKTTLAYMLAANGATGNGPVEVVSCAALPEHLVESLLFGHKKGAFTGAIADYKGAFERAGRGLLLLDDLDKLPLHSQEKLLRALRERRFSPVGGKAELEVRCRIAVATKIPLEQLERAGRLLEDLRYRIEVDTIVVPPARKRPEDVLAVVNRALKLERPTASLDETARHALLRHVFPGNMGEANAIGLSLGHLGKDQLFEADILARIPCLAGPDRPRSLKDITRQSQRQAVQAAVAATGGNIAAAAASLDTSRTRAYDILHGPGPVPAKKSTPKQLQLNLDFQKKCSS